MLPFRGGICFWRRCMKVKAKNGDKLLTTNKANEGQKNASRAHIYICVNYIYSIYICICREYPIGRWTECTRTHLVCNLKQCSQCWKPFAYLTWLPLFSCSRLFMHTLSCSCSVGIQGVWDSSWVHYGWVDIARASSIKKPTPPKLNAQLRNHTWDGKSSPSSKTYLEWLFEWLPGTIGLLQPILQHLLLMRSQTVASRPHKIWSANHFRAHQSGDFLYVMQRICGLWSEMHEAATDLESEYHRPFLLDTCL